MTTDDQRPMPQHQLAPALRDLIDNVRASLDPAEWSARAAELEQLLREQGERWWTPMIRHNMGARRDWLLSFAAERGLDVPDWASVEPDADPHRQAAVVAAERRGMAVGIKGTGCEFPGCGADHATADHDAAEAVDVELVGPSQAELEATVARNAAAVDEDELGTAAEGYNVGAGASVEASRG